MIKRTLLFINLLVVCLVLLRPVTAYAVTPLDPDADASLTLQYQKDGAAFADLNIGIFRIAEAFPDGSFQLIEPFASYPINIHGITAQEQWSRIAQTLCSYIVSGNVQPDREVNTDESGKAYFTKLKTGLYYVREAVGENTTGTYVFNQFLIYIPTPQPDGRYQYAVEAKPKCTNFVPKTQYTVTKLWQDKGNAGNRPGEIAVDIFISNQIL